jgi:ABC-2 type transport system ATP-binding protein
MSEETAIKVSGIHKTFRLPHEKVTSIKSAVVNFYRHRKTFERQHVLKGVSFEVKKGEFFAIVGRNGSGKSTLLKLLAGIYNPDMGSIEVNGMLIPFIELGVGFNPELSGRENVFLNGALLGFNRSEMEAMYHDIVAFAELDRFMDQKLKNYSSGMQVRLAFSIAIRARGDILLLDEVLAVGDAAFQQKCYDYFEDLRRQKKTVIFVSHDMSAVKRFCTSAIYVKDGEIIRRGTPADIADVYLLENIQESDDTKQQDGTEQLSGKHSVDIKMLRQTEKMVEFEITHRSNTNDEVYIGLSLLRNGVSIAEIVTPPDRPLRHAGILRYTLPIDHLNAGVFHMATALFKLDNRELIAIGKRKAKFVVKGDDNTRGAALRLEHTWGYGSHGGSSAKD